MVNLFTCSLLSVTGLNPLEAIQKRRIDTCREIGHELVAYPHDQPTDASCPKGNRASGDIVSEFYQPARCGSDPQNPEVLPSDLLNGDLARLPGSG